MNAGFAACSLSRRGTPVNTTVPGVLISTSPSRLPLFLLVARKVDCPLFKSFFRPDTINSQRLYPENECNDSDMGFSFFGKLRRSHELGPTHEAPFVWPGSIATNGEITGAFKYVHQSTYPSQYRLFHVEKARGGNDCPFWFPETPQLNFGNRQILHRIRNQLETCCRTHLKRRVGAPKSLAAPKRLLKLGVDKQRCYVVRTRGDDQPQYAALSYCWGTSQSMLTTSTLAELEAGVHPSYFSRAIQDAIKVVASLGYQHLWVDAVCILQDDREDVAEEIQKMGDIYHGASFTIAASNSATSREGFLSGQPLDAYPLDVRYENNSRATIMMIPDPSLKQSIHPLHTRGWTLQEAYFSRRYLHFGLHSVKMVCASDNVDFTGFFDLEINSSIFRWRRTESWADRDRPWNVVTERYSSRRLTVPSDKLVAISALAKDFANNTIRGPRPQSYLAGIWRQGLPCALRWEMVDPPQARPAYRAPSWSWASVEGKVRPGDASKHTSTHCHELVVLEAETFWDSSAGPFSSVTGGFIVVRGRIGAISDYRVTSDPSIQFLGISGCLDALEPDVSRPRQDRRAIWLLECRETNGEEPCGDHFGETEFYGYCFGLILLKTADGQSFRRIGWFSSSEKDMYWDLRNQIWGNMAPSEIRIV